MSQRAHLVLADGTVFEGRAIGAATTTVGEAVFTTGMTGYQEVLTDPSYCGQLVTMTAPQMGNTGVNAQDAEARRPFLAGFIVHELAETPSNWRSEQSLDAYLKAQGIAGIADVDTRALTRHIRDNGAQMAALGTEGPEALLAQAKAAAPMEGRDLTGEVTAAETYEAVLGDVGANATLVCGITLGRYAFVAAGAVVAKDVPDYGFVLGVPGRHRGWMSRHGHLLKNPDADGVLTCPESGFRYREVEPGTLRCLDLDEDAPLPEDLRVGERSYDDFKS